MLLELRGLSKCFGSVIVADEVNLSVETGEAIGIIGPNGAGKTTLFNLITGAMRADAGDIILNGVEVTQAPPYARCRAGIGRTHQIPRPFENLTVFENLLVGAVYGYGAKERDAADLCAGILERTHLMAQADRLAGALTLLERKRLEMARALATRPKLLLLDEIAGGLSEAECGELVETIRAIHAAGTTIVWIEHIVHALLAVVGQLIVVNFGRVIAKGPPKLVMNLPEVQEIYMGISA
jgi:branched-chain amino acid transport system ATP-binding protein